MSNYLNYAYVVESAETARIATLSRVGPVTDQWPKIFDVLFRLPYFCGRSHPPDTPQGYFDWWAHTTYEGFGYTALSMLWQHAFYSESILLLRRLIEALVQLRFFHAEPSGLGEHLGGRKRVPFKNMFDACAPGYYSRQYGKLLSGVAHGGIASAVLRVDYSNPSDPLTRMGCVYNEKFATWTINQLNAILYGILRFFPDFFPNYHCLVDAETATERDRALQWLFDAMEGHRRELPKSAAWYALIQPLVGWSPAVP